MLLRDPARRHLLGTLPALWLIARAGTSAAATAASDPLGALQARSGGALGVFALDIGTGRTLGLNADERFAMCSTFKLLLAACVLQRVDAGALRLDQPVAYGQADLLPHAPVTGAHAADGRLSVGALCAATVELSDNPAANLLLGLIGGPAGLTRFVRTIGDPFTRLDRTEPALNENAPGDPRDTTTPRAMVGSLRRVLVDTDVLSAASRGRLLGWLQVSPTGRTRLRAGWPADWRAGDKTGTGTRGAVNDVAIVFPPGRAPWLVVCYLSGSAEATATLSAVHADVGRQVLQAFAA